MLPPFSDDIHVMAEWEKIEYEPRITYEMAMSGNVRRPVRILCDGVYDVFHYGHARQLDQAKHYFPCETYLIAGAHCDEEVHRVKGPTIQTEDERYETVRHCRHVDEVFRGAPYFVPMEFVKKWKIDFLAHDGLLLATPGGDDVYQPFRDAGMFLATRRTEGISTTDLITRHIRNCGQLIERNTNRGVTAQQMNLWSGQVVWLIMKRKFAGVFDYAWNRLGDWTNRMDPPVQNE